METIIHPLYEALLENFKSKDFQTHTYTKLGKRIESMPIADNKHYIDTKSIPLSFENKFRQKFATEIKTHSKKIIDYAEKQMIEGSSVIESEYVLASIQLLLATAILRNPRDILKQLYRVMGEIKYSIIVAPENEFFVLPDTSAGVQYSPIVSRTNEGYHFFSIDSRIVLVLLPISSKVMLIAISKAAMFGFDASSPNNVGSADTSLMTYYNKILFGYANDRISSSNVDTLLKFL